MSNSGWISVHRKIEDTLIYKDSEAVHLWLHLLLHANHKDNKVLIGTRSISVPAGSLLTGRKALSAATGINESKVQRLLKLFENEHQIEQQTFTKYRVIAISNYTTYQEVNNKRTAGEQQVNTNNNVNNVNNKDNPSQKYKYSDEDEGLARYIYQSILSMAPTAKQPNFPAWSNTIRLMRESDKIPISEIRRVFDWANKDSFWSSNILSPAKLRDKFTTLSAKTNTGKSNEANQPRRNLTAIERVKAAGARQDSSVIDYQAHAKALGKDDDDLWS